MDTKKITTSEPNNDVKREKVRVIPIQFFDDLDVEDLDNDYKDEAMLNMLSQLIEYFDASCEKRLIAFAQFSTYYEQFIVQGWLDKYNYEYAPYDDEHIMDDKDKIQILNLFPKKRHDD